MKITNIRTNANISVIRVHPELSMSNTPCSRLNPGQSTEPRPSDLSSWSLAHRNPSKQKVRLKPHVAASRDRRRLRKPCSPVDGTRTS